MISVARRYYWQDDLHVLGVFSVDIINYHNVIRIQYNNIDPKKIILLLLLFVQFFIFFSLLRRRTIRVRLRYYINYIIGVHGAQQ